MSSILTSQGVVFATAMAVSGTVILLALRLQKSFPATQFPITTHSPPPLPRPCISSVGKKREKKKKKKRVHFAEDVVDPVGNSKEFRRRQQHGSDDGGFSPNSNSNTNSNSNSYSPTKNRGGQRGREVRGGMPENRVALYNGILRDRSVHHRLAYSSSY